MEKIKENISRIAAEKNALIIAHNYQPGEIQEIAHLCGDSLELSRKAASNDADIIVFCGVHFMAESASILSPQKKVLLPDIEAGCPMADMITAEDVIQLKKDYPDAAVVTYINSSAEVKAESDVICTSSNAVRIVQRVESDRIIFLPDKNLGNFVSKHTDKEIILWKGFCPTHERFSAVDLEKVKADNPGALVVVHPECRPEVVDMADEVLSTGEMVDFVQKTDAKSIIIGTEKDMIHRLKMVAGHINYIPASKDFVCPNMKKITLSKLYDTLLNEIPVITVPQEIARRAGMALQRMLELSY